MRNQADLEDLDALLTAAERNASDFCRPWIRLDYGRFMATWAVPPDGVPSYAELRASAVETEILGVKVAVCSIEALRQMKRTAGRPRDCVDIEDLDATGQ